MPTDPQTVVLVTNDVALMRLAERMRPPGARLVRVSPEQMKFVSHSAARWWIDLDSCPTLPETAGRPCVCFYSDGRSIPPRTARATFVRKPCQSAILGILWAEACDEANVRSGGPHPAESALPAWVARLQALDVRELTRTLTTEVKRHWQAETVSIYLTTPESNGLILAESDQSDAPVSLGFGEYPPAPAAAVARRGEAVISDDLSATLAAKRIACRADEHCPTCGALLPLPVDGQIAGVLMLGLPRDRLTTLRRSPLDAIRCFIGRAIRNAQQYQQARSEARIDRLTGLYNYRWLLETLDREIPRCRRHAGTLCLLLLDVDGLKNVNDRFGHRAGDAALQHVARQLRACLRRPDSAARIGGDEFVVVLPDTTPEGSQHVAERILETLRKDPPTIANRPQPLTASIGLAQWRDHYDAGALIEAADRAMYAAKRQGRDRTATTLLPCESAGAIAGAQSA
ncbi:MAG: sensor domain-containing diguanylate cyclase [Planctomycetota bacterium]|nr:MAG: sensor domain-containing diguanylate cyclase [Planctomycetota bacterium]